MYAVLAYAWSHDRSIATLRRALNLAPLLFVAGLLALWSMLVLWVAPAPDWPGVWLVFGKFAGGLLLYGYVCVVLAHGVITVLRQRGVLEPAA